MSKMETIKLYVYLHVLLLVYSLGGICSKLAGQAEFLSAKFIVFYALVLFDLFIYALVWQQLLKKLPLVTAYANKAITVIWGMLWGILIFGEHITIGDIPGVALIILGIYLVVAADEN